jgi:predicted PurR-regulated permease PerM
VSSSNFTNAWLRLLLAGGSVVLISASAYWAAPILIPIVIATLLTFVLTPPATALQRHGIARIPAVLLVVTLATAALGAVAFAGWSQFQSLVEELPEHKDRIVQKITDIREAGTSSWLDTATGTLKEIADEALAAAPKSTEAEPVPVKVVPSPWLLLRSTASPIIDVLASVGLVIVLLTFMLVRREDLRNRLIRLLSNGNVTGMTRALEDGTQRLGRYLLAQLGINAAAGAILAIGLTIIGVPYAFLWGLILAFLRYIPYIGAWIAALLPVAYSLAVLPGWTQPLLVIGLMLVLEVLLAYVIEPWVFGHSIGTSEVALLISAAFWTWLWGPVGLLLAAPITACLVVVGRHVQELGFLAVLFGDQPVLEPHVAYYQRLLARDPDEAADLMEDYVERHDALSACDRVLIPALILTRRARLGDELSPEDERFVIDSTREILEEAVLAHPSGKGTPVDLDRSDELESALVVAYPARDQADELAAGMLQSLLDARECRFEPVTSDMLAGELVDHLEAENPAALCITVVPPLGLAHARYVCKRVRAALPDLKIIVCCPGLTVNVERVSARLQAAGADTVATTLGEARDQILPHVRLLAHVTA